MPRVAAMPDLSVANLLWVSAIAFVVPLLLGFFPPLHAGEGASGYRCPFQALNTPSSSCLPSAGIWSSVSIPVSSIVARICSR